MAGQIAAQKAAMDAKAVIEVGYAPTEDIQVQLKEQSKLLSLVEKQKERIQKLVTDNSHEKEQRLELAKKLKAETAAMTRWKSQTSKEFIQLKRNEITKKQQLQKLEIKLKKTDALAKRKIEELSALQKKHRNMAEKLKKKGGIEDPEQLREWVSTFSRACYEYGELIDAQTTLQNEQQKLNSDLDTLRANKTELQIALEKHRLSTSGPGSNIDAQEGVEVGEQIKDLTEEEETLLDKLAYCQEKLTEYASLLSVCDFEEVRNRTQTMLTLADAHVLVEALLEEVITQVGNLKKTENSLELAIEEGKSTAERLSQEKTMCDLRWQQEVQRLQAEFQQREAAILQEISSRSQELDACINCDKLQSEVQRLQGDLETTTNHLNQSVVKCNMLKKQLDELQEMTNRPKSVNLGSVIDRTLRRLTSSVSVTDVLTFKSEWTLQAHTHDIKGVLMVDSMLVSSSYRGFKVWSLEERKLVKEITAHSDYIKAMHWWPQYSSLVTASKSTIALWDLNTGQSAKTLKASTKLDLRAIQTWDNYLAAAGQGVDTCPRLEIWDLRRADM